MFARLKRLWTGEERRDEVEIAVRERESAEDTREDAQERPLPVLPVDAIALIVRYDIDSQPSLLRAADRKRKLKLISRSFYAAASKLAEEAHLVRAAQISRLRAVVLVTGSSLAPRLRRLAVDLSSSEQSALYEPNDKKLADILSACTSLRAFAYTHARQSWSPGYDERKAKASAATGALYEALAAHPTLATITMPQRALPTTEVRTIFERVGQLNGLETYGVKLTRFTDLTVKRWALDLNVNDGIAVIITAPLRAEIDAQLELARTVLRTTLLYLAVRYAISGRELAELARSCPNIKGLKLIASEQDPTPFRQGLVRLRRLQMVRISPRITVGPAWLAALLSSSATAVRVIDEQVEMSVAEFEAELEVTTNIIPRTLRLRTPLARLPGQTARVRWTDDDKQRACEIARRFSIDLSFGSPDRHSN